MVIMHLKVDADILNRARQCRKNFSCVTGNKECLCEVDHLIDHTLLFIKPAERHICNYKMSFGYSAYYCNCPVRLDLYKRYNI